MTGVVEPMVELYRWYFLHRRVCTEIDFAALDDAAVRRAFVRATRATMKLSLVV